VPSLASANFSAPCFRAKLYHATKGQLKELRRVVDALAEVIQKGAIGPWLVQLNDAFECLKPNEVIERGKVDCI
jgi:hypothetical protein